MSRIILGTANFGMSYGIKNNWSIIEKTQCSSIIETAYRSGIRSVDTAQGYGESETIIASNQPKRFDIITKINPKFSDNVCHYSETKHLAMKSLETLGLNHIYAIMLHDPNVIVGQAGKEIISALQDLKEEGFVEKIGISIYNDDIIHEILPYFHVDIIQFPFNAFDQRMKRNGTLEYLNSIGVELHSRSVFLQGLLLLRQSQIPKYFKSHWGKNFELWLEFLRESKQTGLQACLRFALQEPLLDRIVIGVDSKFQLKQIIDIERKFDPRSLSYDELFVDDEQLIFPVNWKFV